jgi:hypothetical protein
METRTDMYGYVVQLVILDQKEVYTRQDGVTVKLAIGTGWSRALSIFSAMQPGDWVPPAPPPEPPVEA